MLYIQGHRREGQVDARCRIHCDMHVLDCGDRRIFISGEKRRAALYLGLGLVCVVLCALAIEHAHALGAVTRASSGPPVFPLVLWGLVVGFGGLVPRLLRRAVSK